MPGFIIRLLSVMASAIILTTIGTAAHADRQPTKVRSAAEVRCNVPKAPVIQVLPKTANIRYDFSQTTKQLTAQGSNTVNPYAANLDTATGGLRSDSVKMKSSVKMGTLTYPGLKVGCLWYDSVIVEINLNPIIYIAKEYQQEPCKSGIMGHELKHVTVDRDVMNKYSIEIGRAVQRAVNQAGAMGPFNTSEMQAQQNRFITHIQSAIDSQELMVEKEMRRRQAAVDSLAEYERVSKICRDVIRKNR